MRISPRSREPDVAVVGGGPAGSTCALLLARAGARVALIDRRRHRFSPVELVSGRARRILESHLKQPLLQLFYGCEIFETVSLWGTSQPVSWSAMCSPWGYGLAVNRANFDEALLGAARDAGVWVIADSEVRSVERQPGAWTLAVRSAKGNSAVRTDHLVLATGATSRTLVERGPVNGARQFACMARVDVELPEQQHTFHLEAGEYGWWYGLPNPEGGRFVGFCSNTDAFNPKHVPSQNDFIQFLAHVRLFGESLTPGIRGTRVIGRPIGPRLYEHVAGDRWIAIGDAALVSDPLSGTGVEFAVESAKLATMALCAASSNLAFTEYAREVQEYAERHTQVGALHHATARNLTPQRVHLP